MRRTQPRRDSSIFLAGAVAASLVLFVVPHQMYAQPPGPERFAVPPKTPIDLWGAIDYLVQTGQSAQATVYLKKFIDVNPTDSDLLAIRDRYGVRSFLRLAHLPATKAQAVVLIGRMNEASKRQAGNPARLAQAVDSIPRSREEQAYAVEQLREAGPFGVPVLVDALRRPGLRSEDRNILAESLAQLEASAIPPLVALLDAKDGPLLIDVIHALGRIGDSRTITSLAYPAVSQHANPAVQSAALKAIERLSGRPFTLGTNAVARLLVDEARAYHLHKVKLGELPLLWTWNEAEGKLVSRPATVSEAEETLGLKAARQALALAPGDVDAQATLVAIAVDKAVSRVGLVAFPKGEETVSNLALMAGPAVLDRALKQALVDSKFDLAAALAGTLGKVTDRAALSLNGQPHPLVQAISAPDRRTQFAAAKALVALEPRKPFLGSSKVVPVLARFLATGPAPKVIVIDGNLPRGAQLAAQLKTLGYDVDVAPSGDQGFRLAASWSNVEFVIIEPALPRGAWRLEDVLGNLRLDPRTAGLPVFVIGALALEDTLGRRLREYPGVGFLVTTADILTLRRQLDRQLTRLGARPFSDAERETYAIESANLLGQITKVAGTPFEPDLQHAGEALAAALKTKATTEAALSALGDIPGIGAQRGLADALLDPARPTPVRIGAAAQLSRSLQRFGPLVTAEQERLLVRSLDDTADDPRLKNAIAAVIGALRPKSEQVGRRLQAYETPIRQ